MVVSTFFVLDKDNRERFFEKSFLLADINPDVVLKMLFLTISNANIDFQSQKLQWRSYTIGNIFPTTKQVKLIGKKEFVTIAVDLEYEAFIVYVAALNIDSSDEVYPLKRI